LPPTAVDSSAKVYFPGLHALRFFAALAVVVGHVELLKKYHGYPNVADNPAMYELGRIAVTFFFVLSGFLITFLLLQEKSETGVVSIRRFYVRRILRIWPLYYLTVLLAFVVLPCLRSFDIPSLSAAAADTRGAPVVLFLMLLPQVALSLYSPVPYAEPLWSIGVEEQFYLLWPLFVSRVRNVLWIAVPVVVAGIALKQGALAFASTLHDEGQLRFWNHFIDYFYFNRFECMAVGAIGAWLIFERKNGILRVLFSTPVQALVYVLSAYAILTTRGKPLLSYTSHSVLFCVIIMNIAANQRSFVRLESNVFVLLGNISYAMYLLHEIAIGGVMHAQTALSGHNVRGVGENVLLYAASITVTVGMSALAYTMFERPFLRLKKRYAIVSSGPNINSAGSLSTTVTA
jgi:peptidoglycan/LPS O-acetylase OafA/YrhL